jgi:hypothetical protein
MSKEKNKKWYQKTWIVILFLFLFFPLGLFLMWKYTKWSKKVKWVLTVIFIFLFISIINTPEDRSETTKQEATATPTIQQEAPQQAIQDSFTKEEALKKVQNYQLQKDFSDIGLSKGATILDYYNARGKIPAIKNEGWYAEEKGQNGTYIVGFKATIEAMQNAPQWEVTETSIKAVNGAATTITPELGVQEQKKQGSDFEKEVYEYSTNLYKQLEAQAGDSVDKQREAEDRSINETAQHFGISKEKVIEIIYKLQ